MRLAESIIKAAILNPEEEIRLTAVYYFSRSFSQDEAVMPLIIQAVERYGRNHAFRMLWEAEHLPQSQATADWLANELRRDYDLQDLDDDNYRFAVALTLYHARADLLGQGEAVSLPMFPAQLRAPLQERIAMLSWDWDRGWAALEAVGLDTMRRNKFTPSDVRYAERIIESLARHRTTKAVLVLDLLQGEYGDRDVALMRWLEALIVSLAGAMQLESAVPLLIERLDDKNLSVADESITALIRIGTDGVVQAIADQWPRASAGFRGAASDVLENIHSDRSAEICLRFFAEEKDSAVKLSLAHAVPSQFDEEGIEPLRQLARDELAPNGLDIRYRLVEASTIMGVPFPEYESWHQAAVADNWGLRDYTPPRLADSFGPDQPGPKWSRNGKRHRWLE